MGYAEEFAKKAKGKTLDDLVVPFRTMEVGDSLYGKLLGIDVVQNEKVKEPCNRYIFHTDQGTESILMGAATDKQLEGKLEVGMLVYVEFQGRFPIDNGAKNVNRWKVQAIHDVAEE